MLVAARPVKKTRRANALHVIPRAATAHAYSVFLLASVLSCTNSLMGVRQGHAFRKNQLLELLPIFEQFALGHIICIGSDGGVQNFSRHRVPHQEVRGFHPLKPGVHRWMIHVFKNVSTAPEVS